MKLKPKMAEAEEVLQCIEILAAHSCAMLKL